MESVEKVPESDLVLCHEVVYNHLPFPQGCHTHHEEVRRQVQVKHLLPPGLSGDLEPTQGSKEFRTMHVALLMLDTRQQENRLIQNISTPTLSLPLSPTLHLSMTPFSPAHPLPVIVEVWPHIEQYCLE